MHMLTNQSFHRDLKPSNILHGDDLCAKVRPIAKWYVFLYNYVVQYEISFFPSTSL